MGDVKKGCEIITVFFKKSSMSNLENSCSSPTTSFLSPFLITIFSQVKLVSRAIGQPTPLVKWLKDGKEVLLTCCMPLFCILASKNKFMCVLNYF